MMVFSSLEQWDTEVDDVDPDELQRAMDLAQELLLTLCSHLPHACLTLCHACVWMKCMCSSLCMCMFNRQAESHRARPLSKPASASTSKLVVDLPDSIFHELDVTLLSRSCSLRSRRCGMTACWAMTKFWM